MSFKKILQLMVAYYAVAVGFNLVSITRVQMGDSPLINGNPVLSIILLSLYLVLAYCGHKHWRWPFIGIGMFGLFALPARGIVPHIQALLDPTLLTIYSSESVAWIAITINCFGFVVLALSFYRAPFIRNLRKHYEN